MKHHLPPRTGRQWAVVVSELAVPAPFERSEFRACIGRHTHRDVELVPAVMRPGAPSGTWLRTDGADYFYYEEQTSSFHQAHIILSLAAHVLLGGAGAPSVEPRLVPGVSPGLVRMMLGSSATGPVTHLEAETFAFLAMERARPACYPPSLARRALRQLLPLRTALQEVIPVPTGAAADGFWPAASSRLHRQVIEIRDASLALRHYRDPQMALAATRAARGAGLAGDELAATVEACVLSAALRARSLGHPVRDASSHTGPPPVAGPDLRSETACLVKVSRAFARLRCDREPGGVSENRPHSPASPVQADQAPFR